MLGLVGRAPSGSVMLRCPERPRAQFKRRGFFLGSRPSVRSSLETSKGATRAVRTRGALRFELGGAQETHSNNSQRWGRAGPGWQHQQLSPTATGALTRNPGRFGCARTRIRPLWPGLHLGPSSRPRSADHTHCRRVCIHLNTYLTWRIEAASKPLRYKNALAHVSAAYA